jgi:hypothetical protein
VTPEGRIKAKIRRRLQALSCEYDFWPVQTGYGKRTLDILICAGGWFVAIEAKKDAKTDLTDLQKETRRQIEAAHGLVFAVYDDASLDEAMDVIEACCQLADHIRA